jgi:hypothetical protein
VERDHTYTRGEKMLLLRDYLEKNRRITSKEASRLVYTCERNARKILAAMCGPVKMYFDYSNEYWQLLDEAEDG